MNNKPTFFNKDMAKRIAKKTAIGGVAAAAGGYGVEHQIMRQFEKIPDNHPDKKSYMELFYNVHKLPKVRIGAGIGAAKGLYDEVKRYRKEKKDSEQSMDKQAMSDRFKRIAKSSLKGAVVGGLTGAASANPLHSARNYMHGLEEETYRRGYKDMLAGKPTSLDNLSNRVRAHHIKNNDDSRKTGNYSEETKKMQEDDIWSLMQKQEDHSDRKLKDKARSAGKGGALGSLIGAAIAGGRQAHREYKDSKMQKAASLFGGQISHEVNLGKDTRDWIDLKGAKIRDAALSAKDKMSPHINKRNAKIGGAGLLGAYALYRGGKAIKGAIQNKLDERSAKRKEDDRINYYKGQMDTHKDNQYMLRALASRMSKEKFDA